MKRAPVTAAVIGVALLAASPAWAAAIADPGRGAGAGAQEEGAGQAIVELRTPELPAGRSASARSRWRELRARSQEILARVAARNDLRVEGRIPETGQLVVRLGGESVDRLRRRLGADPRVEAVQADRRVEPRFLPNDPGFNMHDANAPFADFAQWHLRKLAGPAAWDLSRGGAEVTLIDTGTYVAHPDLAGRVVGTLDCTGGCGGTNVSGSDGHGTHTAGLACADSNNGYGLASLGFDCNLFVIRVSFCSDLAAGIVRAGNRFSDAVSISLGKCGSSLAGPIDYAWSRGVVPVAAAANDRDPNYVDYPAEAVQPRGTGPDIAAGKGLVVTAAKYDGTRAAFAEETTRVSVAAFGAATNQAGGSQGILSTFPPTGVGNRKTINGDNRFAYLVGTSMAAPEVSGLVALIRSVRPGLSAPQVARLIKLTAGNCAAHGAGIGWGVVNAHRAVAAALGLDLVAPGSRLFAPSRKKVLALFKRLKKLKQARRSGAPGGRAQAAGKRGRKRGPKVKLRIHRFDGECSQELPISGARRATVFMSVNGKRYRKLGTTAKKRIAFRPKRGKLYRFYSVAEDGAGNREAQPAGPDAKLNLRKKKRRG